MQVNLKLPRFSSFQRSIFWAMWGLLAIICNTGNGLAQVPTVRGAVYHEQSFEPLVGATITALPSGNGTVTDKEGKFSIEPNQNDLTIRVSFIGFTAQEIQLLVSGNVKPLRILLSPDVAQLSEVTINAYQTGRKLFESPAAIAQLSAKTLQQGDGISFVQALNTVPGVKMEQRSMGSYRISMRGSLLRSPFGMRNIKMYLNGIPITDAVGENPINNIDLSLLGGVEVLKGPASSLYGAGTGGALLFNSANVVPYQTQVQTNVLLGNCELRQYSALVKTSGQNSDLVAGLTNRSWKGYREHENHHFNGMNLIARWYPDEKRSITLMALYADVQFQISGNIDSTALSDNPRQYGGQAKELDASVDKQRLIAGVSQQYRFNHRWNNLTSASVYYEVKDNPYGTNAFNSGIKREGGSGFNLRTETHYQSPAERKVNVRLTAGAEWLHSFLASKDYVNLQGVPGLMREDNELFLSQISMFGQAFVQLPANFFATVSGSYNLNLYRIDQLLPTRPDTVNFSINNNLTPVFSPRVGLTKIIGRHLSAHGSISWGFAPPAAEETILPNGSFNKDLTAESGVNYELGIRASIWKNRLTADISAYHLQLSNEILGEGQPAVYFNAGKTLHRGIETTINANIINQPDLQFSLLQVSASAALQNFNFKRYTNTQPDTFNGNDIPGVVPQTVTLQGNAALRMGLYLNSTYYYFAKMPLNNANTDFAPAYHLLNAQLGYQRSLFKHWMIDLYAGVNNALHQQYSAFHNLNAPGRRYYNPAPDRNFYVGVKVRAQYQRGK